jgi:dihydrofolate synthase/folylpolyglutamate synthase
MATPHFSSSDEIFEYLLGYVNVEKGQATVFKLDRMQDLAEKLGNPHLGRLTIHVAGSKGKGSVSTMCANILSAAGLKVGLYTSPHLLRWKERISFPDKEISEEVLISAMEEILPLVEGKTAKDFPGDEMPTYFELTTLVAFCAFRALGCDVQVIETGLGGRLDSTNIVDPDVSVITPIELEHTQFLGDTIAKIAFEKAGIMKPRKPVCVSRQKEEALSVFEAKATETGGHLFRLGVDIDAVDVQVDAGGTSCGLVRVSASECALAAILPSGRLDVACPMIGAIQAQNMALAAMAAACALSAIKAAAIVEGLARSRLPARFELASSEPAIVLDGAHTPESIRLTLDTMRTLFPGPKVLLFACAYDKRHAEMAKILAPHFDAITVTKPGNFKVSDPESVFGSFAALRLDATLEEDTRAAIVRSIAEAGRRNAALLVTGSFYLCSEAKSFLKEAKEGSAPPR